MLHPDNVIRQDPELWDIYSRKEEYSPRQLDQYGRFIHAYSDHQEIHDPVVSRYLVENGYRIEYPKGKQFAVCLTHDVDEIYPPCKHTILSLMTCIKNMDIKGLKNQTSWKHHGKEKSPYWNFKEIMNLEKKYGARSTFYFLATDKDIRRFRYHIEDLNGELGKIIDRGWEVGLHGGYYTFNDMNEILMEKKRLEQVLGRKVIGYRNHYLRFKIPESWEYLEKAGFKYDSTLGYPDKIGFRNGMCHPFYPYNLCSDKEVRILEIPLIIMDGTLFDSVRSFDEAWIVTKKIIDTVESCHGVLTVNWHSNSFNCPFKGSWQKFYEMILQYCSNKNAWMTTGEKMWEWWNK